MPRVVGSGACFGVVLDGKRFLLFQADAHDRVVVQVAVGHLYVGVLIQAFADREPRF